MWVLDLRSSIGNEAGRHSPASSAWTVDGVAEVDIPWGVRQVYEWNKSRPIDVLAHCMGAVMFCMAALRGNGLIDTTDPRKPRSMVRSLVLSQVGPLVRLSPLNRLRGYILGAGTMPFCTKHGLDPVPDLPPWLDQTLDLSDIGAVVPGKDPIWYHLMDNIVPLFPA